MDVRCERCRAQYVFDDEQVTPAGLAVQCTNCGHVFRVKKKELVVTVPVRPGEIDGVPLPATAAAPRSGAAAPEPREWRVRQVGGNVLAFRELTTLQKWIVEGKVGRGDMLSSGGDAWQRLGDLEELSSFFEIVDRARGAAVAIEPMAGRTQPMYRASEPAAPPPATAPAAPRPPRARKASAEPATQEEAVGPRRGGARTSLVVALLATGAGAAGYLFAPQLFGKRVEVAPIALEVKSAPPREAAKPAAPPTPTPSPSPSPSPTPTVPAPAPAPQTATAPPTAPAPTTAPTTATPAPAPAIPPAATPAATTAATTAPAPAAAPEPDASARGRATARGPKALLAQAERLRSKGDVSRALELYGRVADEDPRNSAALTGRGLCYLDLSQYPPAAASFEAALAISPDDADALLGLGEAYRSQGRDADALRYYERYLEKHPDGDEAAVARNAIQELKR
jgi:predicted Zn finger-like uncharacterized protein